MRYSTVHSKTQQTGVTLIELMVVVAVLAVISAIAIPAFTGYISTSHRADCQNEAAAISLAEEEFYLENNVFFVGADAATLEANSGGLYRRTPEVIAGTANCTYDVTSADVTTTYTVTATGANKLAGKGVIVTKTK